MLASGEEAEKLIIICFLSLNNFPDCWAPLSNEKETPAGPSASLLTSLWHLSEEDIGDGCGCLPGLRDYVFLEKEQESPDYLSRHWTLLLGTWKNFWWRKTENEGEMEEARKRKWGVGEEEEEN